MTAAPRQDIDTAAWSGFIDRLNGYVGARLPAALRDDVVGDILVRLVRNEAKLAAARDPMAWVGRVAVNAVIDHARRRGAENRAMAAFVADPASADGGTDADDTATVAFAGCVTPLIEGLPQRYRDALMLVEIDGIGQQDAARRLGLSVSGLKSRLQRGRRQLKQAVVRCCAIELDRRGGIIAYSPRRAAAAPSCCVDSGCR